MPELFSKLQMRKGRVLAYPLHEPWMDIGNPEDLHRASLGSWKKRRDQFEKNRRK